MKDYIAEYDRLLIEKSEREIDYEFEIAEDFEKKIMRMCEEKSVNRKKVNKGTYGFRKIVAAIAFILVTVISAGAVTNAATDGKVMEVLTKFFGASVVTDENRGLIGKEVVSDDGIIVSDGADDELGEISEDSTEVENQLFEVVDGVTPEIIMTNGAVAVFYQEEYNGWQCEAGDKLVFEFEKYESEVTESQALVVGYVLDGVMYESENVFRELEGRYELEVQRAGEYYIYLISGTSDYLTVKEGKIWVE